MWTEPSRTTAGHPVFVTGCPRSGTSVLSWTIAQSHFFATSTESHFLYYLLRGNPDGRGADYGSRLEESFRASLTGDSWFDLNAVSFEEYASAIGKGLAELFQSRTEGRVWVDSSPEYILVAPDIAAVFPKSRFVHVVRDARWVVRSMVNSGFSEPWANDLVEACETWNHYVETGLNVEEQLPSRVLRVHQEDIRSKADIVTMELFDFLGVDRPENVTSFLGDHVINSSFDRREPFLSEGEEDSTEEPASGRKLRWDEAMRREVERRCGTLLNRLGYPIDGL